METPTFDRTSVRAPLATALELAEDALADLASSYLQGDDLTTQVAMAVRSLYSALDLIAA